MRREQLIAKIRELGLSDFESEILTVSRPCLSLVTSRADMPIPATASKIGGNPDLPAGFTWPCTKTGIPMLFLARIVASDLQRICSHLTDDLLFFADWEHDFCGRIISLSGNQLTRPTTHPERPTDFTVRLHECSVHVTEALSLPADYDEFDNWRYSDALRTFGARREEIYRGYFRTITLLEGLVEQHYGPRSSALARPHRVFGYPLYTQSHPAHCAEQRLKPHYSISGEPKSDFIQCASQWRAVLSLDTDDTAGLCFGDTGNCGFLVTERALASGQFDEAEFYQDNC